MVVGMDNRKKAVAAAGKRMSDTVMNSIDTEGIAERMKAAVNFRLEGSLLTRAQMLRIK